ncbi:MAG: hypothetical protein QOG21_947 [Actinomycetota bacterium]|jgi:hypothetical protein|nr:hypothetical protein [Actinomycetota bacterium]
MLGAMPRHEGNTVSMGPCAAAMAAALLIVMGPTWTVAASAQSRTHVVDLRLVSQRPWLAPGDRLGVTLRLTNAGKTDLNGFLLRVGVYDRITSRSDLHVSFGGTPLVPASAFTKYFPTTRLRAGRSVDVHLHQPVAALRSLGVVPDGGVFPLSVYLYDAAGTTLLDSLTTSLIFYPQPPPVPLNLVLLVPLDALPAEGPDGVFHPDGSGHYPLADALAPSGWLTGMLDGLQRAAGLAGAKPGVQGGSGRAKDRGARPSQLRFALVPSPRLISEIADLANGYLQETDGKVEQIGPHAQTARDATSFLRRLTAVAKSARAQTMLTPYSSPDLPTLSQNFDLEHLAEQLKAGSDVLASRIGARARWLYPPAGRLDASTLDDLRLAGEATHTVVAEGALQQPRDPALRGCPSSFATFACPIRIRSETSASIGFQADAGLQQRLQALLGSGEDRLDEQRFLAETSMIQAETPGVTGRVVAAITPPLWHPRASLAAGFFRDVTQAPWLRTLTPSEGVRFGRPPVTKHVLATAPRVRNEPAQSYFSAISNAEVQVQHYATTLSDLSRPPPLLDRLRQDVLVAQSRLWWSTPATQARGAAYASVAEAQASRELDKVSIGGVNEISMTSQRAQIPFVLSSRADHPVTVNVKLFSPKLGFDRSQLKGIVVQHGTQQIAVEATAQASGIFPVEVTVETPDGFVLAKKSIQVRSTNFNQIALGLTGGALAFLIAFYVWGVVKKRRARPAASTEGNATA